MPQPLAAKCQTEAVVVTRASPKQLISLPQTSRISRDLIRQADRRFRAVVSSLFHRDRVGGSRYLGVRRLPAATGSSFLLRRRVRAIGFLIYDPGRTDDTLNKYARVSIFIRPELRTGAGVSDRR